MIDATVGLTIGCCSPFCDSVGREPSPEGAEDGGNEGAVLSWIRFGKAEETYAKIPYLWLGDVNINLDIEVKPSSGHTFTSVGDRSQVVDFTFGPPNGAFH